MSQESNKEPLGYVTWPHSCRGSLIEKGEKDHGCEQARPDDFTHLFQFANANPQGKPCGLPLCYVVRPACAPPRALRRSRPMAKAIERAKRAEKEA